MAIMSEEAYSLIALITCLLYAVVLWLQFRRARILRRLLRSLTDEQKRVLGLDVPKDDDKGPV